MSLLCFDKNIQYNYSKVKEIYAIFAYVMYYFFWSQDVLFYISHLFFLQNDSNCCSGCWWIRHSPCGETQLADELWFHFFHLHPWSGHSQEYPALRSQICLITNDARRCHGFSFANAGKTTRQANDLALTESLRWPKVRHDVFEQYLIPREVSLNLNRNTFIYINYLMCHSH